MLLLLLLLLLLVVVTMMALLVTTMALLLSMLTAFPRRLNVLRRTDNIFRSEQRHDAPSCPRQALDSQLPSASTALGRPNRDQYHVYVCIEPNHYNSSSFSAGVDNRHIYKSARVPRLSRTLTAAEAILRFHNAPPVLGRTELVFFCPN